LAFSSSWHRGPVCPSFGVRVTTLILVYLKQSRAMIARHP
jgi:hypothetical protein